MKLAIPDMSLVVLIGASGSGKSTFASKHFLPSEVISSDACRGVVSDNENDQSATDDAFDVLHYIASKRLARGLVTVIDATNVQREAREPLIALARRHNVLATAIAFNIPERICRDRNVLRPDRDMPDRVIHRQASDLRRSLPTLEKEGFRFVYRLHSPIEADNAVVGRQPLWNNRSADHGPFDIIGDVHGCYDELLELLERLGYKVVNEVVTPPEGRKAIFLGDLVDRGPGVVPTLKLVMSMVEAGTALCVPGNHDLKLVRKLKGSPVRMTHGLAESVDQLEQETPEFSSRVCTFLNELISHFVLDDGKLVVAHAGMKQEFQGRGSGRVREFALYGETTGETDEYGLPVRCNWAGEYRGRAMVVYGHTPTVNPEWLNNTINIDTGCVFGGCLTALRYPERELVSAAARREYAVPLRPLRAPDQVSLSLQQHADELLEVTDLLGRHGVETKLHGRITVRNENASAALELMSRFAVNPRWLIYLPPTMSPASTSSREGLLEHPDEVFNYFRAWDVAQVVCEQKHMGSRAVLVVAKDEEAARKTFGIVGEGSGICFTRTGRRFFVDPLLEQELVRRVQAAMEVSGLWEELASDWVCLDAEIMPWSLKAQDLLKTQYAAVGAAAGAALAEVTAAFDQFQARMSEASDIAARFREKQNDAAAFRQAYRHYLWPVTSLSDVRVAPFHLLASEGHVHSDRNNVWHMQMLERLCAADPGLLFSTSYLVVDVNDELSCERATAWWEEITATGGEGMVVKPLDFIASTARGLVQPAVKCRGREYLRIIYGPEYTVPENLDRLRIRNTASKRSMALREFALGLEALQRFVLHQPLRRVHECVFAVLAMESEPVDARL